MEGFVGLFVVFLVLAVFALPVWAMVRASDAKAKIASLSPSSSALRDRVRDLTQRISALETRIAPDAPPLHTASEPAAASVTREPAPVPYASSDARSRRASTAARAPCRACRSIRGEPPAAALRLAHPFQKNHPWAKCWLASAPAPAVAPPKRRRHRPSPPASANPTPLHSHYRNRRRQSATFEEKFGESWLNKIGITALVIGMAFLLNYSMHYLGPGGRSRWVTHAAPH